MHSDFEMKVLSMMGAMRNEIDILKEEISQLKAQMEKSSQPADNTASDQERMSINSVRDYIKNQLINRNSKLSFTNGNRTVGKLTISDGNSSIERIMIRTSKSFREKDGYPSGWIMIHEDQLKQYELYFFVVKDFEDELHTLIMNQENITDWIRHKSCDSNGNYHFYVNLINGKWVDDREGEYNCTPYYHNWELVEKILSE